ncbi:MAG TPA: alpha/beta hydrolase [Blastocatellia bacterium]|jgi:pimeloyl-ACP methyl ester carboxylesterase|nr:alpha/beta hydrolase [Blastocatellia bacterium]HCX28570.1 alpha/beta hydrolase [Blastocatellia bacterium]
MSKLGNIWKTVLAGGAGVAALAALNAVIQRNASEPDESALGGEAHFFPWKHGRVFYKAGGQEHSGPPLVFIHGVGAGASSFMWRKNFDELAKDFRVYAFDLLGFGFSDKPPTASYSADLYVELISDFIHEVSGSPANIIASSLGAAYAIRVADEHPELINEMILNAPTGSDTLNRRPGMAGAAFYGLLQSPVLGTSFYNVMASERSIRDYARDNLFYDHHRVTDRLVTNLYTTSHQPGAQHAIAAFLSGYLNTDTRSPFSRLTQRVVLVWGKQDFTTPVDKGLSLLDLNPRARLEVFDYCRMMPEQEQPEKFNALVRDTFLARSIAAGSEGS